jgi:hypothetical protein
VKERRVVVLLWCCFGLNESQCLVLCAHAAVADDDDDDDDHDHDSDAADSNEYVDDVVFFPHAAAADDTVLQAGPW